MKKVTEILAAVGGAIVSFFVTMPPLVWILIAVMTIDYITGLICGAMGKSKKTENGYLFELQDGQTITLREYSKTGKDYYTPREISVWLKQK